MIIKAIILVLLLALGVYIYSTNWFQSSFLTESYYKEIALVPFDIAAKGEQTTIPIHFKHKTCYALGVQVPGSEAFHSKPTGKGRLGYKFISGRSVIAEGVTRPVPRTGWGGNDHVSIRKLMVFDLPFRGFSKGLSLELEVVEPFSFMQDYKGQTSIVIKPNYEPKVGGCYNEDLRIEK